MASRRRALRGRRRQSPASSPVLPPSVAIRRRPTALCPGSPVLLPGSSAVRGEGRAPSATRVAKAAGPSGTQRARGFARPPIDQGTEALTAGEDAFLASARALGQWAMSLDVVERDPRGPSYEERRTAFRHVLTPAPSLRSGRVRISMSAVRSEARGLPLGDGRSEARQTGQRHRGASSWPHRPRPRPDLRRCS